MDDVTRESSAMSQMEAATMHFSFFSQLSLTEPVFPASRVYDRLTEIWCEHTKCSWAWMWLYNQQFSQWELVSQAPVEYEDMRCPNNLSQSKGSVAEYCCQMMRPELVASPQTWKRTDKYGNRYAVAIADWLAEHGCETFVTVPILSSTVSNCDAKSLVPIRVRGAVCLHYKSAEDIPQWIIDDSVEGKHLLTMGRQTSSKLVEVFQSQQFRILYDINRYSSRFLASSSFAPAADRYQFLSQLIADLQRQLDISGASVFYRIPYHNLARCIFSTGLCDDKGVMLAADSVAEAHYAMNENRTGEVFATGLTQQLGVGTQEVRTLGKYNETSSDNHALPGATLLCPIPRSSTKLPRPDGPKSDGVIRFTGHPSRISQEKERNFDPLETQLLQFTCGQLSPILDMLSHRIDREIQVNTIKHDLYAPQPLIRHSIDDLSNRLEKGLPIPEYVLSDLKMAAMLSISLIAQLDADPSRMDCDARETLLEGDIIARLKSIMKHYAKEYRNMLINFESFSSIPAMYLDRILIERVFFNLIANAIKYGKKNSIINITNRVEGGYYVVDIKNYGIGIGVGEEERIFKLYYRSPHAREAAQGAGLGLYISQAAMRLHGGFIKLTRNSEPTIFSVYIPRSRAIPS